MKRKIAEVGPRYSTEEAERLKAILRTRADNQFELDKLFHDSPTVRHQTRQKLEKLLVQAEAAETMAPGLQRDMSKMASVTDEEAKILGLDKMAGVSLAKLEAVQKPTAYLLARREAKRYGREAGEAMGSRFSKKWGPRLVAAGAVEKSDAKKRLLEEHLKTRRRLELNRPSGKPLPIPGAKPPTPNLGVKGEISAALNKAKLKNTRDAVLKEHSVISHSVQQKPGQRDPKRTVGEVWKGSGPAPSEKTASIAPGVDAWFEKMSAAPSPAIGAKALRVTTSPGRGRIAAQSALSGGSA